MAGKASLSEGVIFPRYPHRVPAMLASSALGCCPPSSGKCRAILGVSITISLSALDCYLASVSGKYPDAREPAAGMAAGGVIQRSLYLCQKT
jgi:hypothetical protein